MNNNTNEEVWKDIPGFEGHYQASTLGRVRSLDRKVPAEKNGKSYHIRRKGRIMKNFDNEGYRMVTLRKNGKRTQRYVHVFIAETFISERKEGMFVNHKNEIKTDNRVSNLEYITHEENINYGTRTKRAAEKLSHPIIAKSLDTGKETRYESIQAAMRDGFNHAHGVLTGKRNHCHRHIFKRVGE